jgi:hypothetical protein
MDPLTATPQEINPTDFGLDNFAYHAKLLHKLESKRPKPVHVLKGDQDVPVLHSGNDVDGWYYITYDHPKHGKLIAAYIHHEVRSIKFQHKPTINIPSFTQIALWRSDTLLSRLGLPLERDSVLSTLFFKAILPKYKVVASDKQQTPGGRAFWERRLLRALKEGFHVYLIDLGVVRSVPDPDSLDEMIKIAWGTDASYKDRRWIISTEKL